MSSADQPTQPVGAPLTKALPRPYPRASKRVGHWGFIEPLEARHASDLFDAFAEGPEGFTYLPEPPFPSLDQCARLCAAAAADADPQWYAVCDPSGRALGHATYLRIDPAHGVIEVGWIHFSRALQRTPLATQAMYQMMAYAMEDLGYRRYEWKCDSLNAPSRAAATRLGFSYEGTFRQATTYKGRNRDTAWFSILDTEWPALKTRFDRWLDPANFDAEGRQKRSLTDIV